MSGLASGLREGSWVTRERLWLVSLAVLAASVLGLAFLLFTSDGMNDYQGRPLGTDFSNVYAAGSYALEGRPAAPFHPPLQYEREQAIFGSSTPFYGWHYPPFFLFVAALLALMPYGLALLVWQGVTFALYLKATRAVMVQALTQQGSAQFLYRRLRGDELKPDEPRVPTPDRLWLVLAIAFPAVFVNLGHGHNGFLTAALLGGGLLLLDHRPILAGVCFGLLAYKPQFGLLIPLALIAGGYGRAFVGAALTVAMLVAVATFAFGSDIWAAFSASTHFTRTVVLEAGDTGWHKIQSVFSWVRMWGGPVPFAYAAQAIVSLGVAAAVVALWRSHSPFPLKAAALCIGAILATPYSLDYDMMVLAPAIAFLAGHGLVAGFAPYEKSALAILWFMPFIARSLADMMMIPFGVLAMFFMFIIVIRKAAPWLRDTQNSYAPAE